MTQGHDYLRRIGIRIVDLRRDFVIGDVVAVLTHSILVTDRNQPASMSVSMSDSSSS